MSTETPNFKNSGASNLYADQVAAKNDDAKVRVQLWGKAAIEGFRIKEALICRPGALYANDKHEPLLESLRKLCMRRYRKNILNSFLKYIKGKFISLWKNCLKGD